MIAVGSGCWEDGPVRRESEPDELIGSSPLMDGDQALIGNRSEPTQLAFALLLKFFELDGRSRHVGEQPPASMSYVAQRMVVKLDDAELSSYDWLGRTVTCHRAQIRNADWFREETRGVGDKLVAGRGAPSAVSVLGRRTNEQPTLVSKVSSC